MPFQTANAHDGTATTISGTFTSLNAPVGPSSSRCFSDYASVETCSAIIHPKHTTRRNVSELVNGGGHSTRNGLPATSGLSPSTASLSNIPLPTSMMSFVSPNRQDNALGETTSIIRKHQDYPLSNHQRVSSFSVPSPVQSTSTNSTKAHNNIISSSTIPMTILHAMNSPSENILSTCEEQKYIRKCGELSKLVSETEQENEKMLMVLQNTRLNIARLRAEKEILMEYLMKSHELNEQLTNPVQDLIDGSICVPALPLTVEISQIENLIGSLPPICQFTSISSETLAEKEDIRKKADSCAITTTRRKTPNNRKRSHTLMIAAETSGCDSGSTGNEGDVNENNLNNKLQRFIGARSTAKRRPNNVIDSTKGDENLKLTKKNEISASQQISGVVTNIQHIGIVKSISDLNSTSIETEEISKKNTQKKPKQLDENTSQENPNDSYFIDSAGISISNQIIYEDSNQYHTENDTFLAADDYSLSKSPSTGNKINVRKPKLSHESFSSDPDRSFSRTSSPKKHCDNSETNMLTSYNNQNNIFVHEDFKAVDYEYDEAQVQPCLDINLQLKQNSSIEHNGSITIQKLYDFNFSQGMSNQLQITKKTLDDNSDGSREIGDIKGATWLSNMESVRLEEVKNTHTKTIEESRMPYDIEQVEGNFDEDDILDMEI